MPTQANMGLRHSGADKRKIKVLTSFNCPDELTGHIEYGRRQAVEVLANNVEPTLHLAVVRVLQEQHGILVHDVELMKIIN